MKLVSWLICVDRYQDNFSELTLNTCLSQTYKNIELIIIINGKNRKKIFNKLTSRFGFNKRIKIILSNLIGLTQNLNYGVSFCNGEYISRIDIDDFSRDNRIEEQVNYLEKNKSISCCGTMYSNPNNKSLVNLPLSYSSIKLSLYFMNPICHPSIMIRRDDLIKAGGYIGGIYAQDYDLWLRMIFINNMKIVNLNQSLIVYQDKSIGSARNNRLSYKCVLNSQLRILAKTYNPIWVLSLTLYFFKYIYYSLKS